MLPARLLGSVSRSPRPRSQSRTTSPDRLRRAASPARPEPWPRRDVSTGSRRGLLSSNLPGRRAGAGSLSPAPPLLPALRLPGEKGVAGTNRGREGRPHGLGGRAATPGRDARSGRALPRPPAPPGPAPGPAATAATNEVRGSTGIGAEKGVARDPGAPRAGLGRRTALAAAGHESRAYGALPHVIREGEAPGWVPSQRLSSRAPGQRRAWRRHADSEASGRPSSRQ